MTDAAARRRMSPTARALASLLASFGAVPVAGFAQPAAPPVEFFVAPGGSDDNAGSREQPFRTLERARNAVRALRADAGLPPGGVAVNLREGLYVREGTFALTAQDSGAEGAPVVYRPHPGERAVITGARRIEGFAPVADAAVLERLDEAARDHVLQVDLPARGITDFGELRHRGMAQPIRLAALELFFDGRPMQLARWPNEGFVMTGEVIETGSRAFSGGGPMGVIQPHEREEPRPGEFVFDHDRLLRWVNAPDAWIHGYFGRDWSDEHLGVQSIDPEKRSISPAQPTRYGHYAGKRFYILNVLEELDSPGEWYLDRATGILYFWPPSPIDGAEAFVTLLEEPLVSLHDASHVTLQGLILEGSRADAVRITGGESALVLGCTIRCIGNRAVVVSQGRNHRVVGCDIHDTGDGAVYLTGGDRVTLEPSGHLAENNHIHNYSRWCRTYRAAVSLHGVGNTARHNLIHSAAHYAVTFSGNDNLFELNEVHSVVRETTDSAALYMGMNPTFRGNVIRHNFFHHIGSALAHSGQAAVYFDDGASGSHIYGNIFWRVGGAGSFGAGMVHGGKDNVFENNIFAECRRGMTFGGWSEEVWAAYLASDRIQGMLAQVSVTQAPYITRYPELARLEGNPCVNQVRRNVAYRCGELVHGRSADRQEVEGNITVEEDPGFAGLEAGVRWLRDDALPFQEIGFEPIPLDRIGLYEDEHRASWPVEHEVLPPPQP